MAFLGKNINSFHLLALQTGIVIYKSISSKKARQDLQECQAKNFSAFWKGTLPRIQALIYESI